MSHRRGFTIVEVAIVLTIMAILLVLGISSYTSSQLGARNNERKADAENIARALERYYTAGNIDNSPGFGSYVGLPGGKGMYPSRAATASEADFLAALPGLEDTSRRFSFGNFTFIIDGASFSGPTPVENAASTTRINSHFSTFSTTSNVIVYQPIAWDSVNNYWAICRDGNECRRFKLFYRLEKESIPQVIESVNQ